MRKKKTTVDAVLQFRHLFLTKKRGRLNVIRRGIAAMDGDERIAIRDDIARLAGSRANRPERCPLGICEFAYRTWFEPLLGDEWQKAWRTYENRNVSFTVAYADATAKMSEVEARLVDLRKALERKFKIFNAKRRLLHRGRREIALNESSQLTDRSLSVSVDYLAIHDLLNELQKSEQRRAEVREKKRQWIMDWKGGRGPAE